MRTKEEIQDEINRLENMNLKGPGDLAELIALKWVLTDATTGTDLPSE